MRWRANRCGCLAGWVFLSVALAKVLGDLAPTYALRQVELTLILILLAAFELTSKLLWLGFERRYGLCELSSERAVFVPLGWEASHLDLESDSWAGIPQAEIRGWRETPAGLLVDVPSRSAFAAFFQPYLVPIEAPNELAIAKALLRGEDPVALGLTST